ncbi:MAG: hypothetical protein COW67_04400 [Flavobacteriales bacterium CG18_big_fil_WC_8_21_14_2_50_32_9]|nr:MAG: hypothetical protein COW67_04400 [Flavobacteriales bacterium CG18_big_fil_WC_8_21_14_2_50_32_9]PJC61800.1 MAG: hypothetical protein CO022_07960 [Flavobacteriales bacterium CG_4_9_14_0_2_um_filter_32_27]
MGQAIIGLFILCTPALFLVAAYLFYKNSAIQAFIQNKLVWKNPIDKAQYAYIDKLLSSQLCFFKLLSLNGKAKFIHRTLKFKESKNFIGKDELVVTEDMKLIISGASIQLTFGLNYYMLENIKGFYIYPTVFYNRMMKLKLRGATPPSGNMMLSWKHVELGFMQPNDKYNLALHEMAHALKLSIKYSDNFDANFYRYINEWKSVGMPEFQKMKHADDSFLREYAAVNIHEFFAVCVEHFFEVPTQFQYNLPHIYFHLCILLNLDPINVYNDYKVKR